MTLTLIIYIAQSAIWGGGQPGRQTLHMGGKLPPVPTHSYATASSTSLYSVCCTVMYCAVLCCAVLCCAVLLCAVLYSTVHCSAMQCSAVQCSVVQCSAE